MEGLLLIGVIFAVLIAMVVLGFQIYIALAISTIGGIWLVTGSFELSTSLLASTVIEALRDYVFAVIPLFVLMGEFLARSGAANDLFRIVNRGLSKIPGRLGVATVVGNTIFAAAVGVSIASAATFTRIAYPEMKAQGYKDSISLGCIAGSACLGMLIPPSVLLIIYGMINEMSIGQLFAAGIIPGIALASLFILFILFLAFFKPHLVGEDKESKAARKLLKVEPLTSAEIVGGYGTIILIFLVLGGIWFGWFTPTEAGGIGAFLGLVLALVKGLRWKDIKNSILHTGRVSTPILFLLLFGAFYSRLLSLAGAVDLIDTTIQGYDLAPIALLIVMIFIWFILGMFIDSASIILLSIPIFAPLAASAGFDPLQFAIIAILAIEAGILTPPLGLIVYTVKAAVNDDSISLGTIFMGGIPYWIMLLGLIFFLVVFPGMATYLPGKM